MLCRECWRKSRKTAEIFQLTRASFFNIMAHKITIYYQIHFSRLDLCLQDPLLHPIARRSVLAVKGQALSLSVSKLPAYSLSSQNTLTVASLGHNSSDVTLNTSQSFEVVRFSAYVIESVQIER